MKLRADALRNKINMDDDSSSDWDSLTEPAPAKLHAKAPPKGEIDSDEETSVVKDRKVTTPPIIPHQQSRTDSPPVWTPRKGKDDAKSRSQDVDFRPALSNTSPQLTPSKKAPGKDRKGTTYDAPRNTYDPPRNSYDPPRKSAARLSQPLKEDSDDEALSNLRKVYEQNRPRNSLTLEAPSPERRGPPGADGRGTELKSSSASKINYPTKNQGALETKSVRTPDVAMATSEAGVSFHSNQDRITVVTEEGSTDKRPGTQRSGGSFRSHDNLLVVADGAGGGGGRHGGNSGSSEQQKSPQVYYFDETHTEYYLTKPEPSVAAMEVYADRAEMLITRGWKEVFGALRMVTLFVTVFFVELFKFVIGSVLRPLYVTTVLFIGDGLLKPLFSAVFNAVIQPAFVLVYNSASGFRLAVGPLLDVLQRLTDMVASILASFRLVAINHIHSAVHAEPSPAVIPESNMSVV